LTLCGPLGPLGIASAAGLKSLHQAGNWTRSIYEVGTTSATTNIVDFEPGFKLTHKACNYRRSRGPLAADGWYA
jgi:hypothetical protein